MAADKLTAQQRKNVSEFIAPFRVKSGKRITLAKDFDPGFKGGIDRKKDGVALLAEGVRLLSEYQARLAAQDTWGVLVVLQALDAAGKDGTIRHVMSGVNPQGVSVHSFKTPSAEELDHDFLWRYAQRLPEPWRDRDLQPLALRGGAGRPRPPPAAGAPEAASSRAQTRRLEAALPGHQQLGAVSDRQRVPDSGRWHIGWVLVPGALVVLLGSFVSRVGVRRYSPHKAHPAKT